jgi:hypothetical protein
MSGEAISEATFIREYISHSRKDERLILPLLDLLGLGGRRVLRQEGQGFDRNRDPVLY